MSSTLESETIETPAAFVRIRDGHLVEITIREDAIVDVPEMDEILAAQVALAKERPVHVLVDSRNVRSMTRAAQERIAKTANQRNSRAVAILTGSPVSVLLGNFFLRLGMPVYPTRLFRDEASARKWLHTYSLEDV
jgi:hypothetical protein